MTVPLSSVDLALVRRTGLFDSLDSSLFYDILSTSSVRKVSRAETLFIQGDFAKYCFIVLDGWVKLYRLMPRGDEAIVAIFTRGQSFAEAVAFMSESFPVSGEAITDGRLLCIPVDVLTGMIATNPKIALAMLASISRHVHHLVQQIAELKSHTGPQRVAEFLVSLAPIETGPCTISLPYDKALIAGRLGMKPESLSRSFARLREVGVRIHQTRVAIEDVSRLQTFALEKPAGAHHQMES
ncbi:MAG: Crp/Fnr family transcriptional regulator [Alphaproteobacteria bacterium]